MAMTLSSLRKPNRSKLAADYAACTLPAETKSAELAHEIEVRQQQIQALQLQLKIHTQQRQADAIVVMERRKVLTAQLIETAPAELKSAMAELERKLRPLRGNPTQAAVVNQGEAVLSKLAELQFLADDGDVLTDKITAILATCPI